MKDKNETEEKLNIRFGRTISHNGYMYKVNNNSILATDIDDYTIAIVGLHSDTELYTKRSMTEESLIETKDGEYAEIPLPRIVGSAIDRPTNIEARGSLDFALFVDKEEDETTRDVLGEIEIVLQKDGVEIDRTTMPPF